MKYKIYLVFITLTFPFTLFAQFEKEMEDFNAFVKQQQKEFTDFVEEQNKEFASFLKEHWKEYDLETPVIRPKKPEPTNPVVFDKNKPISKPQETPVNEVSKLPVIESPNIIPTLDGAGKGTPVPTIPGEKVPSSQPSTKPKTPSPTIAKSGAKPQTTPEEKPKVKPDDAISLEELLEQSKVTPKPVDKPTTKPVTQPTNSLKNGLSFSFYGISCSVDNSLKNTLSLRSIEEKDISKGWETLSKANYKALINNCIEIKNTCELNDWGYLLLSKQVAEILCGKSQKNEIALMQMFILCQSGYKAKVARAGNNLILLYSTDNTIYGTSFIRLQGVVYYMFNYKSNKNEPIYTYNKDFANSTRLVNMNISASQMFSGETKKKVLNAKGYPISFQSSVNTGLVSFYNDYPQCDFSVYVTAPVSNEVQESVLPPLRKAIEGKSETEAANILLNFVQTAFEYQTDDEQFGYEKPFFVEELFYYPYSDCEDRAVLYSYLVRTLTGLDVVLLDYPEHIATAVRFNTEVSGDYVKVDGRKYTICDPTYIGSSIGQAMPSFKNVPVKVLKY